MKSILFSIIFAVFFSACSKNVNEGFNKPASFWYERLIVAVSEGNLEQADSYYNSLSSEHSASPLLGEALLMLIKAHIDNKEHLLAGFFVNEYKTRFSNANNVDYISLLGIETNFYAFSNYSKDQGFIDENIGDINHFVILNQNNEYIPYISHILTSFKLSKLEMNDEIIRIYNIKDKEEAKEKYKEYNSELGVQDIEFIPSYVPWYVKIFSW